MATPTIVYCDPSIDADTGNGTLGSPYGRYGYMLSTMTFDTTNGNFLAIKQGTTIVGSDWAITTSPAATRQLTHVVWSGSGAFDPQADPTTLTAPIFDGGGVNVSIFKQWGGASHAKEWINFYHFVFQNAGTAPLITSYQHCIYQHCGFRSSSGGGISGVGSILAVHDCFFDNVGGTYLSSANLIARNCYFYQGANTATYAIYFESGSVTGCIFDMNSKTAIHANGQGLLKNIANNTLVQRTKGTIRDGIWFGTTVGVAYSTIHNNIFVGFEATLDGWLGTDDLTSFMGNSFYDNVKDFNAIDAVLMGDRVPASPGGTNNEKLAEDPFLRTGSRPTSLATMPDRFAYYRTKDNGLLRTGGYPFGSSQYRGAVPPAPGSGSSAIYPFGSQPTNWRGVD